MARDGGAPQRHDPLVEDIVCSASTPVTAYGIVRAAAQRGTSMAPVQIYRSIARLLEQKRIVRIASLRAFVPGRPGVLFHVHCDNCGAHASLDASGVADVITGICQMYEFAGREQVLEAKGMCRDCRTRLH